MSIIDPSRWLDEETPKAFPLHCAEIEEAFGITTQCCSSCHDDEDLGYASLMELEGEGPDYQLWGIVCCAVSLALDEVLDDAPQ